MTAQPVNQADAHDPSPVYVHREPSALRKALPWVVLGLILTGIGYLAYTLIQTMVGRAPSFTIYTIRGGWVRFLLFLLAACGVLALTSLIGQRMGQRRTGRVISYWAVLGDQLTHLFLILVVLVALYPLLYVLLAAFDPKNSLFSFPDLNNPNLLYKSGLLPKLGGLTWENFGKLFDGVSIPAWQLVLGVAAGASLGTLLVITLTERARGTQTAGLVRGRTWSTRVLMAALVLLIVFMTPAQFQGQGNESKFLLSVRNTLLVSGLTGALAILLSTTAGYAMARLRFPGRFETLLFFIFVQMFPVFLALVAIYTLLFTLGLINSFTGLILAYSGGAIAFNTWIYKGYVESLPESLEEAAMVDGATRWTAFTRVVLPLSGSMLVFIFLNQFIGTYAEFILANVLLTGVEKWTVGVMLRSFTAGQFSTKWGIFAAAATLGALPIIILFYSFQRYFTGGAVAGGVKE